MRDSIVKVFPAIIGVLPLYCLVSVASWVWILRLRINWPYQHNQSVIKKHRLHSFYNDGIITAEFIRDTLILITNGYLLIHSGCFKTKSPSSDIHPVGVSYFPAVIPKGNFNVPCRIKRPIIPSKWLAMDHEFSYSFGLEDSSHGRKSLERRHGRSGNGTHGDHPKGPPSTTTTRRKRSGFTKMLTYRGLNSFSILMGFCCKN
ncbi:ATM_1a_G0028340.mRNA.1.CDS.1 [Saccharomyces cerevisiae]|nr:ATM_1a_G0028340.mRNA.1.CDS.1 [Saccharomyces cerevisiae]CAI7096436.1 ATM_1a_G0028340.mRNA.1.CDS.1 [Saccharomyces cerevisiae]